jgi:microcystin-dependent protein
MSVTTTVNRVQYNGDDSTTSFSVPLYFLANSWIKVILTSSAGADSTWTEGVDYTLTGATVAAGGTLTATTAPATGERLTIYREAPYNQLTTYEYSGSFPADANEDTVDKNTILIQQVRELADTLAITFPQSEPTGTANTLPEFETRKGKYVYFTDAGVLTVAAVTAQDLLDEDDMVSNSATEGATQQSIVAYTNPAVNNSAVQRSDTVTPNGNVASWGSSNGVLEDGYAFLDEDDMSSNSATGLASQQSIKAYAARQPASTTEDNIPQWDAVTGELKDGLDFLDEDDMSSDSATALPSQQSVKAYVDTFANPIGGMMLWPDEAAVPNANWLKCDGQAVSRTTYATLFGVVGTKYGVGDGSTTFNLPDLAGVIPVGQKSGGTFATVGATGGSENASGGSGVIGTMFDSTSNVSFGSGSAIDSSSPNTDVSLCQLTDPDVIGTGGTITTLQPYQVVGMWVIRAL